MTDKQFEKMMTELEQIESNTSDKEVEISFLSTRLQKIIELLEAILKAK